MKKIMLLIACVLILSCGFSLFSPLSPPSWIIGDWEGPSGVLTFTFTKNNVLMTSPISNPIDYKDSYSRSQITENEKNDVKYEFTIKIVYEDYGINEEQTNRFIRQSSNKLIYYLKTDEKENTPLEFTKKMY